MSSHIPSHTTATTGVGCEDSRRVRIKGGERNRYISFAVLTVSNSLGGGGGVSGQTCLGMKGRTDIEGLADRGILTRQLVLLSGFRLVSRSGRSRSI